MLTMIEHKDLFDWWLSSSLQLILAKKDSCGSNSLNRKQGCQMAYFHTKKSQFGYMLEGLEMENVGIFYGHLKYVTSIGRFFDRLKIFGRHLIYFPPSWYIAPRKIWQT
jgi:hypothetical protein